MRTFGILAGGWIVGAAVVVALSSRAAVLPASARGASPSGSNLASVSGYVSSLGDDGIIIPVAGLRAADLHDTFSQSRAGGRRRHNALDILAPRGTPVIAAVDGTIRKLDTSGAGGITIYQFNRDETRVYYYAHLDRYAGVVAEGLYVPQGTVIGYVGTTGNAPPGTPHLHFAVEDLPPSKEWWKGTPVNPYPLLTATR
jgi:peptidoglycan LD-endopeptidase LytH